MDTVELLREPVKDCHAWFEPTMSDVTAEQAPWRPPGVANPIAAVYAHVILGADFAVNTLMNGRQPLIAGDWSGRAGLSELMPVGAWHEWAAHVRMDLDALRQYARAVYGCWDDYLASPSPPTSMR